MSGWGGQMQKNSQTDKQKIQITSDDWNLYQAAFIGGFTGGAYILVMFSLSHILSVRGLGVTLIFMFFAATAGACIALGIATLLNFVKHTERRNAEASDLLTSVALARLT